MKGGYMLKVNNFSKLFYISIFFIIGLTILTQPVIAKTLTTEARSVIQRIQTKGSTLSGELNEFHSDFARHAEIMVNLENMIKELRSRGFLGKEYSQSPEKYERIYAEYAKNISEIKNVFIKHFPKIQNAVADFNRSIYYGKDRIIELRSDDLAIVDAELRRSKQVLNKLQNIRAELDTNCPKNNKISKNCKRQWRNYQRQLLNLKRGLARLKYMKKISNLKDSISHKLTEIMEQYVYKESETVDMLMNYAVNFEQYSSFSSSNGLGGMLSTIRELGKLNEKMKDFSKFQQGLDFHVADMGKLVENRLDHFMKDSGIGNINVESRGEVLRSYEDQEEEIADMIRELEGIE